MSDEPSVRFLSTVLCDDIRKEENGKELLIGVYSGSILIPKVPRRIMLQAWINVEVVRGGQTQFQFRVIDEANAVLSLLEAVIGIDPNFPIGSLNTPKFPLELTEQTTLRFQAKIGSGRWQTLLTKPLNVTPPTEAPSETNA